VSTKNVQICRDASAIAGDTSRRRWSDRFVSSDEAFDPKHLGDGVYVAAHGLVQEPARERLDEDSAGLDITVGGDVITFMWDYGVRVPLWGPLGLLPDDPRWPSAVLRLSDSLIEDLTRWGDSMLELDAAPSRRTQEAYERLDERAQDLAQRLQAEVGSTYTVRYRSW
jgi:hypothetical protein